MNRAAPLLLPALLGLIFAVGCGGKGSEVAATRMTVISRGFLPPSGAPGIRPPRLLEDAHALWTPVSAREEAVALAAFAGESLPLFAGFPEGGARQEMVILPAAWVPRTEETAVRAYLRRFTGPRRDLAARALHRAERHMDMLRDAMRRHNLPPVLACLPLVESAFETDAVSSAGAAGLWQLMPDTARRFGLVVSDSLDERFDARKATEAAAAYLRFLYGRFDDWPLAVAAYNCGEGAMERAMRRTGGRTLAEVTEACRQESGAPVLPDETLGFVPRFAAAVSVMAGSAALGLTSRPLLETTALPMQSAGRSAERISHEKAQPDAEASPEPLPALSGTYDPDGAARPAARPPSTQWLSMEFKE